jgi:hypothetical protein
MKAIFIFVIGFIFAVSTFAQSDRMVASAYSAKKEANASFEVSECFPKRASDNTKITIFSEKSQEVEIMVLDANEQIASTQKTSLKEGENEISLPLYHFENGRYTIYVQGKKFYQTRNFYVSK